MTKNVVLLVMLLLFVLAVPVGAAELTVSFNDNIVVTGPTITLGEVATIEGDSADRLHSIKLGSAAAPGGHVVLTPELISMRLSSSGADFTGVTWHIPPVVTVTTAAQLISGATILDKATTAITERLAENGGDTTVASLATPADVVLPVGNATVNIEIPYGLRFSGTTAVNAVITVEGHRAAVVPLRFEIKMFRPIVVAARPLSLRQVITADDLRMERADVGRLSSGYITDVNKVVGLASRRSLASGAVVTAGALVKPVLIKRGSAVKIVATGGGIEVTAGGQALQDGAEGQAIRVKNVNSNKIIIARVLDDASVQVLTYNGK